jgi:Domain of unknown function (DUF4158)
MRPKILSADEIDALYARQRFTLEERDEYFALSTQEKATLGQLHFLKSKMFFILQLGYFKARPKKFALLPGSTSIFRDAMSFRSNRTHSISTRSSTI